MTVTCTDTRLRARSRLPDVLLLTLFAGALVAPSLDWAVRGIPEYRRLPEERMSTQLPAPPADLAQLSKFPSQFEGWYDDSLGLRAALLSGRSRLHLGLFGTSPTPAAYLGTDAWVFLNGARDFDTWRGAAPLSRFELEAWVGAIDARRRWCNARGIDYIFALVPAKTTIYPERHPLVRETIGPTRFDQLAEKFVGDDVFLDLRPALRAAKALDRENDHAYFPYGSHWTDRGSTAGATVLFERIRARPRFREWRPITQDEQVFDPEGCEGDNWAGRLYLRGVLEQNERWMRALNGREPKDVTAESDPHWKHVSELEDPALPSVIFFHDSFGESMAPFFKHRAARCVDMWYAFEPALIEEEKPDLVVELFVEHILFHPPIENIPEQAEFAARRFDASSEVLFTFDPERDAHDLVSRGGITAEREGDGLRLVWKKRLSLAELPEAVLSSTHDNGGRHVVVRLDLVPESACEMSFFYLTRESPQYLRANSLIRALAPGENRVYLDLGLPGMRGPIVFLSPTISSVTLKGCEVRAVR